MKRILMLLSIFSPSILCAQFGVSFHQSNLPFVGLNYEIKNKLRPEIRVGTDNYFDALSIEGILSYDLFKKQEYDFYAGIGVRVNGFSGIVVPLGLHIYPLSTKQFGFHIELAPIIREESLLRGSWGIRYRFNKKSN